TDIYTLSLHDALPISRSIPPLPPCTEIERRRDPRGKRQRARRRARSSSRQDQECAELLSRPNLAPPAASITYAYELGNRAKSARSEEHTSELQSRENL